MMSYLVAPHHLFGTIDGAERYSTGKWIEDAKACIQDITKRGKTPILAGGTGLYLAALTQGLSPIPDVSDQSRERALAETHQDPAGAHGFLTSVDPEAASRIEQGDLQRVSRALEVYYQTGQPISSFQTPSAPYLNSGEWFGLALTPPRQTLYARIESRFDQMLETGAPDEAQLLHARGLSRDLPIMRAHGMPGFCDYFEGRASLEAAIDRAKRDTRRYAKRQFTWITHQFPLWPRVPVQDVVQRTRIVLSLLNMTDPE